nr:diguanylate cyclase [uncultured Cohaesibacter sp.]
MYHRQLDILIVGSQPQLVATLRALPEQENFSHHFRPEKCLYGLDLSKFAIAIIDFETAPSDVCDHIPSMKKNGTILIGCFSAANFSLLSEIHHHLDLVWTKPFDEEKVVASFTSLQERIKRQEDADLTEAYLDTLIDSLPDLVWFKDARGSHLKVNDSFTKAVNKSKDDIQGRGHYYIWGLEPDEYAQGEYICLESEEIVLNKRETCLFDETVKCGEELRKFKTYKSPVFDKTGDVIGTVGFAHDVTDLQNLMIELNILVESLPFAVLVTDKEKVITNANQKFVDIFLNERSELIGKCVEDFLDESKKYNRRKTWAFNEEDGSTLMHSDNRVLELHDEKLLDIFGVFTGHIYLFVDITHEYQFKKKLQSDANTDYLTKLNNRRNLQHQLRIRPPKADTALILIDLDSFKQVNDKFGHDEGDRVLVEFSRLLRKIFPLESLFRLGGDEFAVLLPEVIDVCQPDECAEKLRKKFDQFFSQQFAHTSITASIGVAIGLEDCSDFSGLFKRADMALYKEKRTKKAA